MRHGRKFFSLNIAIIIMRGTRSPNGSWNSSEYSPLLLYFCVVSTSDFINHNIPQDSLFPIFFALMPF
jgi:hypothetical protein